jgi:hypothetical protein
MKTLNELYQLGKTRHLKNMAVALLKIGVAFLGILAIAAIVSYMFDGPISLWKFFIVLFFIGLVTWFYIKTLRCPRCGKLDAEGIFEPFVLWIVGPSGRLPNKKCPSCGFSYSDD